MPLFVNKTLITDQEIKTETGYMRAEYAKTFPDQSIQEQEKTLFNWALENITERVLLKEYALKTISISEDELKENTDGVQSKIDKLIIQIKKEAPLVTEKEVKDYYKENKNKFMISEKRHVKHIVKHPTKKSLSEINKIYDLMKKAEEELKDGVSFEKVGGKYSDCSGNGLDLGYISIGEMVEAFENTVFSLKKNETSEIFETEFGFHIAKVYDISPPKIAPFEQVSEQILKELQEERTEKYIEDFVDKLKSDSNIKYINPKNMVKSAKIGFTFTKPLNFLLIKPSGPDCNISCDYCFYLKKGKLFNSGKKRMNLKTVEKMIKQAAEQSIESINIGWQGGEPLLMGLDFFKEVMKFQKKYGQDRFTNSIQTNGILLNKDWAMFFKNNKFLVGLSIDGNKNVHDKYRRDSSDNGTFKRVEHSAKLLLKSGVEVNSLSVVNDHSSEYIEETYTFLKGIGFTHMQFIPVVDIDPVTDKISKFSVDPKKYGEFLSNLFDMWKKDFSNGKPNIYIRFFESVFYTYLGMESPDCNLMSECGKYLVVEHNGDIYPCDFFVDPKQKLGNLNKDNLLELLNSEKQNKFGKVKKNLPAKCEKCKWVSKCFDDCPKNRMMTGEKISYLCEGYKMFFEHADKDFKKFANNLR